MPDPNFDRTVVLLLAHDDEGALGLVLNRPSSTEVDEPLPRWERLAARPQVVFVGGPVARTAAICLARVSGGEDSEVWASILGELGTLSLEQDPDELSQPVDALRIFAGYAGWGAGQLEDEIAAGAWFVIDARPEDALSPAPESLWRDVLRRQGGNLALVAAFPPDPSLN
jgi:putative transcriptional regulator